MINWNRRTNGRKWLADGSKRTKPDGSNGSQTILNVPLALVCLMSRRSVLCPTDPTQSPSAAGLVQLDTHRSFWERYDPCVHAMLSGTHQAAGWSLSCDPCPAGEYQSEQGEAACTRCPIGLYQDEVGQQACKACPKSSSTVGLGSLSISDCGWKPNTINVLESTTSFQCVRCSRGLHSEWFSC